MYFYFVAFLCIFVAFLIYRRQKHSTDNQYDVLTKFLTDKNWNSNAESPASADTEVYEFKINIPDEDIKYLNHRLDITRFPIPSISSTKFNYGVRDDFLKNLIAYWRVEYKWKEQEKMLNTFNHFKTKIEGLNVHFIHEKPAIAPRNIEVKPILLIHGWPGSFVEYLEVIKRLTNPKDYAANETDVFAVVCPSIPGYGFSDAPEKEGFNGFECARVFHKLMIRLGYKQYFVAGGDWGSFISNAVSILYPSFVVGCYTTLGSLTPKNLSIVEGILSYFIPSLYYSDQEIKRIFPLKKLFGEAILETGYFHLQSTKPDTVGFALSDSPVGLAAYIVEKFSTWTDTKGRDSNSGMLTKYWSDDQLLNNVMIYWWGGNITSSMRFYKENMTSKIRSLNNVKVRVPGGFGWFPNEFIASTKHWMSKKYSNLIHFTYMKAGGHFNAYQCPDLFAADVRLFVRRVKKHKRDVNAWEKMEAENVKSSQLDRFEIK